MVLTPLLFIAFNLGLALEKPAAEKGNLRVSPPGDFASFWKVHAVEIEDSLRGTVAHLQVENISHTRIEYAVFYAEYFDSQGRFCFSLTFSLASNFGEGGSDPVAPGENRDLYASVGLTPAAEPKEVRLYLLRQRLDGSENSQSARDVPVRVPLSSGSSFPAGADFLQLHSELESASGPILELALVELTVNERGVIEMVEPLQAVSLRVRSWFENFLRQLRFWPATQGGIAKRENVLVLARAVTSAGAAEARAAIENKAYAPRNTPWVASYAQTLQSETLPPVIQLVFMRPPARIKKGGEIQWTKLPPAPPNHFELWLISADWDPPGLLAVIDPSLPGKLRRVVAP